MNNLLPDMAMKRAELSPDKLAFHDTGSGEDWSFSAVNAAADAIAHGLRTSGLEDGDRIAILCRNRAEFFLTLFACQKTGIILCPLNWRLPAPELTEMLSSVDPKILIHEPAFAETAAYVARSNGISLIGIEDELKSWIAEGGSPLRAAVPATRPWYLLFTSGTTSLPKSVIQTAQMAWANAVNIGQAIGITGADKSINFLPLFHTAGINLYTLPIFLNGGFSTILPKFEADQVMALLAGGDVTQFFGVPAIYQAFSLQSDIDTVDWANIRCGCGGAALPAPLSRFFIERGATILNGFGMTETGPTVFLMDERNAAEKIGSVGRAQMLTEVRLAGVSNGCQGQGEIQLRGPNITPGYFQNTKATEETFTEDGWLRSGDIGRRDADGYYYIVDRIKDMYITGGENVYPAEVERVLITHPGVMECSVIGVPDEKWGEVGAAFIILEPGQSLDLESLRPWCRERLAGYKVPAVVHIVDVFPRTAAGKVRKPELRKLLFHD